MNTQENQYSVLSPNSLRYLSIREKAIEEATRQALLFKDSEKVILMSYREANQAQWCVYKFRWSNAYNLTLVNIVRIAN